MTVLVTGARGSIARTVISRLSSDGYDVRAASRDPEAVPAGARPVLVDFTKPETLPAALDGVDTVFLYAAHEGIENFTAAARNAGVSKVVLLSSAVVAGPGAEESWIGRSHLLVERAIDAAGLRRVFVRPAMFATNALWWRESIVGEGVVRVPYPDALVNPIHDWDIAEVATMAITTDRLDGREILIDGPGGITQREQVRLIGEAIGKELTVEELPREVASRFMPEELLDMLAGGGDAFAGPTSEEVTGRPARTFAQWAVDHAADFR